jgi:hypothetical protein
MKTINNILEFQPYIQKKFNINNLNEIHINFEKENNFIEEINLFKDTVKYNIKINKKK